MWAINKSLSRIHNSNCFVKSCAGKINGVPSSPQIVLKMSYRKPRRYGQLYSIIFQSLAFSVLIIFVARIKSIIIFPNEPKKIVYCWLSCSAVLKHRFSLVRAFFGNETFWHFTFPFLDILQEPSLLALTSQKHCPSCRIESLLATTTETATRKQKPIS